MLNDSVMSRVNATSVEDRRKGDRVPYPAELVLAWMHDLDTPVRYRIVDVSDGGFRIRTTAPVIEGTTGMAMRLLPEGTPINKSVMVVWVSPPGENGERDAGLRYF